MIALKHPIANDLRNVLSAMQIARDLERVGDLGKNIEPSLRARNKVESIIMSFMFLASFISIMTTLGIVLSLLFETIRFFGDVSPIEFFFGTTWSPQIALREGQVASEGSFGAVPVFAGTFMITIIAMVVATPIGLMSAVKINIHIQDCLCENSINGSKTAFFIHAIRLSKHHPSCRS